MCLHGVQGVGSRGMRLNVTADSTESDAHALEHARAVPDPLRDAASDEEGCRHGHFGQAVAPEGDFGAQVDLSDGGMDLWHGWHGSSSLYRYLLVKLRWLQWLE